MTSETSQERAPAQRSGRTVGGMAHEKFTGTRVLESLEVWTPNGWVDAQGVGKTVPFTEWHLVTASGRQINCADKHILVRCDNVNSIMKNYDAQEVFAKDLSAGDYVETENGPEMLISCQPTGKEVVMYDLQVGEGSNHHYYTNGFTSHNSVWLQNVAKNAADGGFNVVYITLEMSEKKTIKRIGSMRLDIPIAEYDTLSKDVDYIKERLERHKRAKGNKMGLFEDKVGSIYIKEFPAASATPDTLESYIKLWQETTGLKLDMLVVDYIGIMSAGPGAPKDNLYQKGKMLAEGLRALGQKYDLVVVTATQISKDSWGVGDINLNAIPESKAIAETADSVWAIIRTGAMKAESRYILKALKLRDSNFEYDRMGFELNRRNLNIENDRVIDAGGAA